MKLLLSFRTPVCVPAVSGSPTLRVCVIFELILLRAILISVTRGLAKMPSSIIPRPSGEIVLLSVRYTVTCFRTVVMPVKGTIFA